MRRFEHVAHDLNNTTRALSKENFVDTVADIILWPLCLLLVPLIIGHNSTHQEEFWLMGCSESRGVNHSVEISNAFGSSPFVFL